MLAEGFESVGRGFHEADDAALEVILLLYRDADVDDVARHRVFYEHDLTFRSMGHAFAFGGDSLHGQVLDDCFLLISLSHFVSAALAGSKFTTNFSASMQKSSRAGRNVRLQQMLVVAEDL